ncbi:HAMP domain-containing protein [Sneathiella sp. P13V-1]|uniref:ATP-binding protein n=1 Tax=Sneathiella sp. P13V-1 TaxID=2697366 RepID=UPI00187BC206|nr:ATP-binding protein [Sneathiella sp. P13V-1]MBE7638065.1 HAMP domain-containing protein [Sneathiella sp. P13V-1]
MKIALPIAGSMKRFMPRTLFARSLLIVLLPTILLQILATYIFYERHWNNVARRLAQGVSGEVAAVISLTDRFPGEEAKASVTKIARDQMRLTVSFLDEALGTPPEIAAHDYGFLESHLANELRNSLPGREFIVRTAPKLETVIIRVQLPDEILQVIVRDKRLFSSTTYIFIMWMVGISLALLGIAIVFLRNQMRPIRQLAKAADEFGKGHEIPDFKPSGAQEIRLASNAFHEMKHRIKRQITQRTEMLAGVSHDLRTPLTRMTLQLAMMPEGEAKSNLTGDVEDMRHMVEGYLAFAKGQEAEAVQEIDLVTIVRDVVENARRQGANIDLIVPAQIVTKLRANSIKRGLTNLVENARRHASEIRVTVGHRENQILVLIDDDGPGIPADQRDDVFRPFHRLDSSRNSETGGSGLGMTITRDIIMGHGGHIVLADSPFGGLRVEITLPA